MWRANRSLRNLLLVALLPGIACITACSGNTVKHTPQDVQHPSQGQSKSSRSTPGHLAVASGMLGVPYRYGGASPSGFDCSGLVYYSYSHTGIKVPRTTVAQYQHSRAITRQQIKPGDLVFFKLNTRKVSHVGIYAGSGRFIHAPSSGKYVAYANLEDPYWRARIAGFRRFN